MSNEIKDVRIKIEGMSCASCAATIDNKIGKLPGVKKIAINYATGEGYVSYQIGRIKETEILDQINRLGYRAVPLVEDKDETVNLSIDGMSCASCAATIEKQLKQTDGITDARINYANEKGVISYRRSAIRLSDIQKIISKLGYEADIEDESQADDSENVTGIAYRKMLYSSILAGIVMALMILKMVGLEIPAYHLITSLLGFPVVFILGSSVHRSSLISIKNRTANMDVLVSMGSLPPYIIGLGGFIWNVQTFIEMATAIMTFHLIGKYLETKAKGKTSEAIKKMIELGAKTARIEKNGEQTEVPVQELVTGDVIIIKPGEKIPIDGVIVEGSSSIDESMVTGESMPVYRRIGDEVIGATINKQGYIKARVSKTGKDTFLAQVINLVEQCQGSKVPIQDFADKVTGYFVPIIILLTFLTFLSYNIFPEFHRQIISWGATFLPWVNPNLSNLTLAFITATAVLVIACPCALGLGTPTALMVGSGLGAENGILIRSGEAVQTLRDVKAIAFDKTGTITIGKPEVTDIITYNNLTHRELLLFAASLEDKSEHPLAHAIVEKGQDMKLSLKQVTDVNTVTGKGIRGEIDNIDVMAGNRKLMNDTGIDYKIALGDMDRLESEAKTMLLIVIDGVVAGLIAVADKIKEDSPKAIKKLDEMGITTIMITGDNVKTAEAIAQKAGIKKIAAEILPQGKVTEIIKLQNEYGIVAMVGDGINDAPALKQANVGIALGSGTDVAIEAADVTLIRGELLNVVASIELSKAIFRKIKENFFWAWFYNLVAIPVAMMGLLHPMIGAAAMSFSSLNVVYNSLRLKRISLHNDHHKTS